MIELNSTHGWFLDDNGITVVNHEGKAQFDLRNDYEVVNVEVEASVVTVRLRSNDNEISHASALTLVLQPVTATSLQSHEFPELFEGIYDYDGKSCSLCIGNEDCISLKSDDRIQVLLNPS